MTAEEAHALNERIKRAYSVVFGSPDGKQVLADLIAYCNVRKSTFDTDPRTHAFKEGQRDVALRIAEFINLSLEDIYNLRR